MSSRGKKKKAKNEEKRIQHEKFEKSQSELYRFSKLIKNKSGQNCSVEELAQLFELSKIHN